jgi:hypothetical protein
LLLQSAFQLIFFHLSPWVLAQIDIAEAMIDELSWYPNGNAYFQAMPGGFP